MVEPNKEEVLDRKIATWKNKLIDLSRRNRLLNFRPTKVSTIKIIDEIPSEVFRSLVIESKSFHFLAKEEEDLLNHEEEVEEQEIEFNLYALEELEAKYTDLNLQTDLSEKRLQKKMKNIYFRANQLMEEQGYNILYLSLGMLKWFEADQSDVVNRSPLIMVPVELRQRSIKSQYKLYPSGDDPFVNPAIQYKLDYEFNLTLPDLPIEDQGFDPQEYFLQVKELVRGKLRWNVTNDIYLGLFSFAKFVMFKELEKYSDLYRRNAIIQALAGIFEPKAGNDAGAFIRADELDEKRKPMEMFQVLDADASQQESIEAVKSGRSVVIQGPPGTGKSQTITNIISESLAANKRVLFVSEKMAALEVVYRRLQKAGFGKYCLEIHSRKANKRHVLDQLKDAYQSEHPGKAIVSDKIEMLIESRNHLTDSSRALHTPLESFGKSPFWLLGRLNLLRDIEIIDLEVSDFAGITFEKYKSILATLETLGERIRMIGQPTDHPFWGCSVDDMNELGLQRIRAELKSSCDQISESMGLLEEFSSRLGIGITTIKTALSYCSLLEILAEEHTIPEPLAGIQEAGAYYQKLKPTLEKIDFLKEGEKETIEGNRVSGLQYDDQRALFHSLLDIEETNEYLKKSINVLDDIDEYQKIHRQNLSKYNPEVLGENMGKVLDDLKARFKSFLRVFKPEYYRTKKMFKKHLKAKERLKYKTLLSDAQNIMRDNELKASIREAPASVSRPLGPAWKGQHTNLENLGAFIEKTLGFKSTKESICSTPKNVYSPLEGFWKFHETDTSVVRSMLDWLVKYQESRSGGMDDQSLIKYILDSKSVPEDLTELRSSISAELQKLKAQAARIGNYLVVSHDAVYGRNLDDTSLEQLLQVTKRWNDNLDKLIDWSRYQRAHNECEAIGLKLYLDSLIEQKVMPDDLVTKFQKSILYFVFVKAIEENPLLERFDALTQDQIVAKFQQLDDWQRDLAKIRVKKRLYEQKPDANWEGSKTSELGYLQRQFRLKRGHHPIRKVFANVPRMVQKLCPCFMMSPLSLSQFVDPKVMKFDVVVFDEASQMSPVDSLGSIVRADQLVVVGDTKQLPPTSFFDRVVQTVEEEDDDFSIPDLESILDECLTIGIPQFTLKWHYRSRHEALIHFSNQCFYRNRLNTFPSANSNLEGFGVSLVQVESAEYDRGRSGKNVLEAQAVAEAVMSQFKDAPDKSVGVGTFSQAQQVAVLDQLELLRRQDPSMENFFTHDVEEHFFVKNLETIQGDERDVIFVSVGYGRDSSGRLTMNFGPINKVGGERRLNVLVTRAREKVVVFSSISGDDIDLSKTQSVGVLKLKEYLDYAKVYGDHSALAVLPEFPDDFDEENSFERSVYEQLLEKGIKVIPQVGFGGYKIDFGVLDPDNPSRFILGLECDGAMYHSSATARDRDRLRQRVLENLGWRFYRIWSTDWFLNPSREMAKLLEAIEHAKGGRGAVFNNSPPKEQVRVEKVDPEGMNDNFGLEIGQYTLCPVKRLGSPEEFYEITKDYGYRGKIDDLVDRIVQIEGPIHIKELSLRVIQHFDMGRVGAKIDKIMKDIVLRLQSKGKMVFKESFVYKHNAPNNLIRTRTFNDAVTNIELVPPEEIQNAVLLVIRKEGSISRHELIPKTARVFGFFHTGKKIFRHIDSQVSCLLKEKTIVESEFGLRCSRSKAGRDRQ